MGTYASDVTISLGLASTTVKLKTVKQTTKSRAASLNMACPQCPTQVKQYYVGDCGHAPDDAVGYTAKQTRKGRQVGDEFLIVTDEEQAGTVASQLAKNVVELSVHAAGEVDGSTVTSGTVYWAEPTKADPFYPVLCRLVAKGDRAYVAVANVQGHEKMVRLLPHNGGFLVAEIARPDEVESFSTDVEPAAKYLAMADELAGALCETFDPVAYSDHRADKVQALLAAKAGGGDATVTPITTAEPKVDGLEAALAAALAAAGKAAA